MKSRSFVVVAVLALCHFPNFVLAQTKLEKLALLSTVGDSLTIVTYQRSTGSHLDANLRRKVAISDRTFDYAALAAASAATEKLFPSIKTVFLSAPAAWSSADPSSLISSGQLSQTSAIVSRLRQDGVTHLLLITKHRATAMLQLADGSTGSGYLEGLGFYIDNQIRTTRLDTGESGTGFVAPYAYIELALVDLESMQIQGQDATDRSSAQSAARNKNGTDPWGALSAEEKVSMLKSIVEEGISDAVPRLFRRR